ALEPAPRGFRPDRAGAGRRPLRALPDPRRGRDPRRVRPPGHRAGAGRGPAGRRARGAAGAPGEGRRDPAGRGPAGPGRSARRTGPGHRAAADLGARRAPGRGSAGGEVRVRPPAGAVADGPRTGRGGAPRGGAHRGRPGADRSRGKGAGTQLVEALLDRADLPAEPAPDTGRLRIWAHGEHPAAARLAEKFGFARPRELWRMGRELAGAELPEVELTGGVRLRT